MATIESPIFQTIAPVTHDLGGFKVHRTLPSKPRTMVGPFIFFDQMGPAKLAPGQGIDVRPHPHINLATVTYLFAGAIDHRDSLGTVQRIEPGAVNLMTAGSGHRPFGALAGRGARRRSRARRDPDLARLAQGQGGGRTGLRACARPRFADRRGRRRSPAADHGRGLQRPLARHPAFADHLRRDQARAGRGDGDRP